MDVPRLVMLPLPAVPHTWSHAVDTSEHSSAAESVAIGAQWASIPGQPSFCYSSRLAYRAHAAFLSSGAELRPQLQRSIFPYRAPQRIYQSARVNVCVNQH